MEGWASIYNLYRRNAQKVKNVDGESIISPLVSPSCHLNDLVLLSKTSSPEISTHIPTSALEDLSAASLTSPHSSPHSSLQPIITLDTCTHFDTSTRFAILNRLNILDLYLPYYIMNYHTFPYVIIKVLAGTTVVAPLVKGANFLLPNHCL